MLFFALSNEWAARQVSSGTQFNLKTTALVNRLRSSLPYRLTADQAEIVGELTDYAMDGRRISALLQGDVGSGKTIVAFLLAAAFIGSGYQAVLMAPTQVLAKQHYTDACKLFEPLGVKVAYLDSKLKKKEEKTILADIASGAAQLIIGTETVMASRVQYKKLAFVITDEEHKFGVQQRTGLVEKGSDGVHMLTMSATPISRSLASTIYGNSVEAYSITTKPAGRKPIVTKVCHNRPSVYSFLLKQIRAGHKVYVVCPMIEDNDKLKFLLMNVSCSLCADMLLYA